MNTVSISELKAHLSQLIREVVRGGEVVILKRGKPIARLVGLGDATDVDRKDRLIEDGILRPGRGDAGNLLDRSPIDAGASLCEAIVEDREDRIN